MATINEILNENSSDVGRLLRRFHVVGKPSSETIEKAYNAHGDRFMMKLLEIVVPSTNSFTGLIQPLEATVTAPLDTKPLATSPEIAAAMEEAAAANQEPGKAWKFWENLLNGITKTGETIAGFKENLAATPEPTYTPQQISQNENRSRTLYMIAGGIVIFLVLILLIFRK